MWVIAICDVFHNRDQGGDIGGNLPPDYDSGFSFSYYSSLTGGRSQELHLLKLEDFKFLSAKSHLCSDIELIYYYKRYRLPIYSSTLYARSPSQNKLLWSYKAKIMKRGSNVSCRSL